LIILEIMKNKELKATIEILIATAIWGTSFFIIKDLVVNVSPTVLVGYRFLLAALLFGGIGIFYRKNLFHHCNIGILMGFIYSLAYIFQTIGMQTTSSANSSFITGLFVLTTPVFSYFFFKTIPSKKFFIALILAATGLWILTGGISKMSFGDMITLVVPVAVGLYTVLVQKYIKNIDLISLLFQQSLVIGLVALSMGLIIGANFVLADSMVWSAIVYLAVFPAALSTFLQIKAQKHISANKVGLITSLEPVFASLFAWTLGGELMNINIIVGGVLILIATVINEIRLR